MICKKKNTVAKKKGVKNSCIRDIWVEQTDPSESCEEDTGMMFHAIGIDATYIKHVGTATTMNLAIRVCKSWL
jgi:hypothetical protein